MHTVIVANFAGTMNAVVIADFAGAMYPMVVTRLIMGATATGG